MIAKPSNRCIKTVWHKVCQVPNREYLSDFDYLIQLMIFVTFWALILTVVSFLYLCVCVDGNSGSPLAMLKNFMFETLPI
jgi:hypothetical protein